MFHKYLTGLVFSGGESGAAVLKMVKHTAAVVVAGCLTRGQLASERLEEFSSPLISVEVNFTAKEANMRGQDALRDVRGSLAGQLLGFQHRFEQNFRERNRENVCVSTE